MKITFESISSITRTMTCKLPLSIGESFGVHSWGIQPTFGMTADDMGFQTFIMTIEWSRKNRMIPMSEIDDDIKSLMSAVKWGEQ